MFQRSDIQVSPHLDMVRLQVRSAVGLIPYLVAFEIVQAINVASKHASDHDRVRRGEVLDFRQPKDADPEWSVPKVNRSTRHSGLVPTLRNWRVDTEGSIVTLHLDSTPVPLHYTDWLAIGVHWWRSAKEAKAWAGDYSRGKRLVAYLTDAEQQDKRPVII